MQNNMIQNNFKLNQPVRVGNATITKTQEAQMPGEYKRTALDDEKDACEILVIQVGPRVVKSKSTLSGRGVKDLGNGLFKLTDSAWMKESSTKTWATDF
jgi:outer membrane protease